MRLPDAYSWLELPLQAWVDWANNDRIGLGYANPVMDRMPACRVRPAISMPESVFHVEQAVCSLPNKWREIVKAEWIYHWPHWYAAKRFKVSRPTHLALRKHAYGLISSYLMHSIAADPESISCANSFTFSPKSGISTDNMGKASSSA